MCTNPASSYPKTPYESLGLKANREAKKFDEEGGRGSNYTSPTIMSSLYVPSIALWTSWQACVSPRMSWSRHQETKNPNNLTLATQAPDSVKQRKPLSTDAMPQGNMKMNMRILTNPYVFYSANDLKPIRKARTFAKGMCHVNRLAHQYRLIMTSYPWRRGVFGYKALDLGVQMITPWHSSVQRSPLSIFLTQKWTLSI